MKTRQPKPLTAQQIFRLISFTPTRRGAVQASEAQRRYIAALILKTGTPFDRGSMIALEKYRASNWIETLKATEAAGGYEAQKRAEYDDAIREIDQRIRDRAAT